MINGSGFSALGCGVSPVSFQEILGVSLKGITSSDAELPPVSAGQQVPCLVREG